MKNDWIMFYISGEVRIDVVLEDNQEAQYPYGRFCVTPHYGKVSASQIIERRARAGVE